MSGSPHRLAWAPPFLVGVSAAVATEVSLGLLLYTGPGLVRSLTAALGVTGLALAGGLWSAPAPGPGGIERLRRRWLFSLIAFLTAAVFGVAWSVPGVLGDGRVTQAVGLTLLAALPLFASGSVLGGMAAMAPTPLAGARMSAAAVLGAGLGFVLTGLLLPRTPLPGTLLLVCLVMLSLGGMILGSVLDGALEVHVRAERASGGSTVRVEDRRRASEEVGTRVLLEGEHERRRVSLAGGGTPAWDVMVAEALLDGRTGPCSVLTVGGGASDLARSLARSHSECAVEVLERSSEVVELAEEHLETELRVGSAERVSVRIGNIEDLVKLVRARYDLVFVDARSLDPIGGSSALSREARARIVQAVAETGALVWGPTEPDPEVLAPAEGWPRASFDREEPNGPRQSLIVLGRGGLPDLPEGLGGFVRRNGGAVSP